MTAKPDLVKTAGSKRRPDWAALAIAPVLAVIGIIMLIDAARMADLGGYAGVGPASAPKLVGYCLLGLAVWTVAAAFRRDFPKREHQDIPAVLWIIAGLALQLMLLKVAGFSIASGLLFACTARSLGKRNFAKTIPIGVGIAFVIWVVFSKLLMLNLPAGPLEHLFF